QEERRKEYGSPGQDVVKDGQEPQMRVVLRIRQGCNRRRHASALVMAVPTERVSVVIVPVVVRRPFVAAQALGIRPLAPTARTNASGIESVPGVEAGTHP